MNSIGSARAGTTVHQRVLRKRAPPIESFSLSVAGELEVDLRKDLDAVHARVNGMLSGFEISVGNPRIVRGSQTVRNLNTEIECFAEPEFSCPERLAIHPFADDERETGLLADFEDSNDVG